jgi:methyl-accepting chemotaxis protein
MISLDFGTDAKRVLSGIGKAFAVIEFSPDGRILTANENFCKTLGYELAEIKGQHHSMFVDASYAAKPEYREFWSKLGRGEFNAGEFKRVGKGGKVVWVYASYSPVLGRGGKVVKVVKVAMDITPVKLRALDDEGKIEAISRAQPILEYLPDGTILTGNEKMLKMGGFRLEEIQGRHHSMFVDPTYAQSEAYREFWRRLGRGEHITEEVKRLGKGGKEVWIQHNYNPILGPDGHVVKVVNFMTDVTGRVKSVEQIGAGLGRLANGDLQQRINEPLAQGLEKFRVDFNAALDALDRSMLAVETNANAIQAGAKEISSASDDLSHRTQQQAASLEETTAALREVTETVRKTAEGAVHARQTVAAAKEDAQKTGGVVREAVEAMGAIDGSSKQISQIIGVIDEIAFQTNLLALNAGVEAARAGDAGRGFAVVASEVRALAQRSAEAAKEIKALISKSEERVDQGAVLVARAGEALQRIVTQVLEIAEIVGGISESAERQSVALDQINKAIVTMDGVTQSNAAMVEEATAAVHNLSKEADELGSLVGKYKVTGRNNDSTRRELKLVAPHTVRAPQETQSRTRSPTASPTPAARPARRATANASSARAQAVAEADQAWEEF